MKQRAYDDYVERMRRMFAECRRVIKDDGIMTIMFTHKSTEAWDALTIGIIEAGFRITATWPVKTESDIAEHPGQSSSTLHYPANLPPQDGADQIQFLLGAGGEAGCARSSEAHPRAGRI